MNPIITIILSLLPLPELKLLDQIYGNCGDGLCGFIPGLPDHGRLATFDYVPHPKAGREARPSGNFVTLEVGTRTYCF